MQTETASRGLIVCAALLFSTGGVAIKACGLSNWQVAGLRSGIAAVTVLALMPSARQIPSPGTLGVGVAYAGTLIAFVLANKLTTAANTIYLQSTAPLYLLVLGPWLLHERIRVRDLLFGLCLAVGLGLFFVGSEPPRSTAPDPTRGNLLAIGSGLLWALTLTGLRALGRRGTAGTNTSLMAVVAGNTIAFLVCLPWMLPIGPTLPQDWILIGYLGVFQIGLAYVCLTSGIGQVRAFEAALLLLVEPVFNPLWAWAIHGERPGAWALAGGATILSATVLRSWWDYRSGPPEAD